MKIIEFPMLLVENGEEVEKFQSMGIETTIEEKPRKYSLAFIDGYLLEFMEDSDSNITNMYIGDTPYRIDMPYEAFKEQLINLDK